MGASSSCQIFEQLSSVLQWVMQSKYKSTVQKNILYVFLFFGLSNSEQCHVNFTIFLSHCEHIGVPINNEIKI